MRIKQYSPQPLLLRPAAAPSLNGQVATRVHEELGEAARGVALGGHGSRVGYMVRGDSKCSAASCQLLFCTTGVLLQRLKDDPLLRNVTHLVVDEVT